jgi:hypothetical protein
MKLLATFMFVSVQSKPKATKMAEKLDDDDDDGDDENDDDDDDEDEDENRGEDANVANFVDADIPAEGDDDDDDDEDVALEEKGVKEGEGETALSEKDMAAETKSFETFGSFYGKYLVGRTTVL